jgi:lysophospholipase I
MMMTSWFDIINIPVTSSEPDTPAGYLDSVSKIHSIIDSVKSQHNLPSSSIILGGFSQGGAMSLLAASSYPESLGGCICLSGWGLSKSTSFPAWSTTHSTVPIFIGHGLSDNVVLPSLGQSCASEIEKGREGKEGKEGGKVTFKTYQGEGHGACEEELRDLALWIDEVTK